MIILSIFGTARGLEVINFPLSNDQVPFNLENQWLEVSLEEVSLQGEQDTIFINRRMIGGNTLTWIGVYRHIFEMGYQRQGSFLGAGAWLINSFIPAEILIPTLQNLSQQVRDKATNQINFIKKIDDIKNEITFNTSHLPSYERAVNNGLGPFADLGFFTVRDNPTHINQMIDWAQGSRAAELFNRGYIGNQTSYVSPNSASSRKQVMIKNQDEADALYVKKLSEVSEQLNLNNANLTQAQQQLGNLEELLNQFKAQNTNLNKQLLNQQDEFSRAKNQYEAQLSRGRTNPPTNIRGAIPTHQPQPEPIEQGFDWLVLSIGILLGAILAGLILLGIQQWTQDTPPPPVANTPVPKEQKNPEPITDPEIRDQSCSNFDTKRYSLTIGNLKSHHKQNFNSLEFSKKIIGQLCNSSPSALDKTLSCKPFMKDLSESIQEIVKNTANKGEVKLSDNCTLPKSNGKIELLIGGDITVLIQNPQINPTPSAQNKGSEQPKPDQPKPVPPKKDLEPKPSSTPKKDTEPKPLPSTQTSQPEVISPDKEKKNEPAPDKDKKTDDTQAIK